MARIRTIKPSFWTDEKLTALPRDVRMTFLGLVSAMADDAGRCKGEVRLVKASVWPLDDDITAGDVARHLEQLVADGRILIYVVDGARYIQIINFRKHQRIDKPRASELPAPPEPSPKTPGPFGDDSKNAQGSVVETSDREAEAERSGNGLGSGAGSGESAPPAPLLRAAGFLPGVIAFVDHFYPLANERRADVIGQLRATTEPGDGAMLSRDVFVRARSAAHLEETCLSLIAKPPIHRDKAIVLVLMRLGDKPKGPTVTEQAKANEAAKIAIEETYHRELAVAALAWSRANPDEYRGIVDEVSSMFRGAIESEYLRRARDSALNQKCAERSGFPDFETWHVARRGVA